MSQYQANPECQEDEDVELFSETQGLGVAQVCWAEEEKFASSFQPLDPHTLEEAPVAETPDTPEGLQHSHLTVNSPEEAASSQEMEVSRGQQAAAVPGNVPRSAVDEKVSLLVSFMLLKYQMKEPIRKADMVNMVMQEHEADFPEILLRACASMEMVFGLDVKEVDRINHYYVISIKLGLTYDGLRSGEDGVPKTGLLILVLGVIFMKGNRASEDEVWEALNVAGMYSGKDHFLFGEPKEIITKEFVREKYVEYRPVANSDPVRHEFLWGPRACAETSKMKVLGFLAKILGTNPCHFPSHYAEALLEEVERALVRFSLSATPDSRSSAS